MEGGSEGPALGCQFQTHLAWSRESRVASGPPGPKTNVKIPLLHLTKKVHFQWTEREHNQEIKRKPKDEVRQFCRVSDE
jgi:hypothetical protein